MWYISDPLDKFLAIFLIGLQRATRNHLYKAWTC